MNKKNPKSAPKQNDVNVVWKSHATRIMREVCPGILKENVQLGRVKLNSPKYNKLNGYVVFCIFVDESEVLTDTSSERLCLMVKAFKNAEGTPRTPIVVPVSEIKEIDFYSPNDSFMAVCNVEWRYAQREDDCEIINNDIYRKEGK